MKKRAMTFLGSNRIFLIIFILALLVRFYNFQNRITFGPEQAISLLVSSDYVNEKFSLLGLPSTQRTTSHGHIIFYPPVFNYSLIPLLVIFNYQAVPITAYFAFLNLITGLVLYFVGKKIFNKTVALFSTAIFLFNDLMINHSLFIWSVNYLPLCGIVIFYLLAKKYLKQSKNFDDFWLGLLSSLAFGIEYLFLPTAILVFSLAIFFSKKRIKFALLFSLGGVVGILPTIIFDLTHEFYHAKTLWQYFLDTIFIPSQSKIEYYHFLQFWPILAIIAGIILYKFFLQSKAAAIVLLLSIVILNLVSSRVSFTHPVGMAENLNFQKLHEAAEKIALDNPKDFNVVMTFDFDSRAHPLRYLLKYNFGYQSLGVEDYPNADVLYVLTIPSYPIHKTSLWEISSFNAITIEKLAEIDGFIVYKLTKIQKAFLLQ